MTNTKTTNRWVYIIAGIVILLFLGLIYAWSIFKVPFKNVYSQWTIPQISLTFTISIGFFCIGGFIGGMLLKKISARVLVPISAAIIAVGFMGVSMLPQDNPAASLKMLYIFYGVLSGGGVGIVYNSVISTVTKWFPDKQGLASGLMMMGFGLGGIVLGSIVNILIKQYDLFMTFRILAIVVLVVVGIGGTLLKKPEVEAAKADNGNVKNYTAVEMIKEPVFWVFFCWLIICSSTGLLVINSAASITLAFGAPAVLGLLVSVFNGFGRVLMGYVFDKVGRKKAMLMGVSFFLAAAICLILGGVKLGLILVLPGMLFAGLGYGGVPTMVSAFANSIYGPKNFATNFGVLNFSLLPAAIIGPMISSVLIERSGGGFTTTFIMAGVLAVSALILATIVDIMLKKRA